MGNYQYNIVKQCHTVPANLISDPNFQIQTEMKVCEGLSNDYQINVIKFLVTDKKHTLKDQHRNFPSKFSVRDAKL